MTPPARVPRAARLAVALAVAPALAPPVAARAFDLHGTNLLEMRAGFDPQAADATRAFTRFEQLDVDVGHGPWRAGVRFESYRPPLAYDRVVRRHATLATRRVEITAGNHEAILGRGLLLRAFEIPGVVREEVGTPQFGDLRDLDGARVRAFGARWDALALVGRPRYADQEPTARRTGRVGAVAATVEAAPGVRVGVHALRFDPELPALGAAEPARPEGAGIQASCDWDRWLRRNGLRGLALATSGEYARVRRLGLPPGVGSPETGPDEGHGLYLSQSAIARAWADRLVLGVTAEYKDYQNLALGVNEPPPAVREHSFALLDRVAHVVELQQERGWQWEARLAWRQRAELVVEWARAENSGSDRFREAYVELRGRGGRLGAAAYACRQQDESAGVHERDSAGFALEARATRAHAFDLDLERQDTLRRIGVFEDRTLDLHAALGWTWAGRLALAVVRQTTDDPAETGGSGRRAFDALSATVPVAGRHEAVLFWGRRRSGLACTSGTCYKVRAFDGVSARLVSRF